MTPATLRKRLIAVAARHGYSVTVSEEAMRQLWADDNPDDIPVPLPSLADNGPRGVTNHPTRRVVLRPGLAPDDEVRTLAHEVAHIVSYGLDRTLTEPVGYAMGEQVAEQVSATLATDAGLAPATGDYAPANYIAEWRDNDPLAAVDAASIQADADATLTEIRGAT